MTSTFFCNFNPILNMHLIDFFTLPGKPILLGPDDAKADLYPILSTKEPDDEVEFNFSGPFRYSLAHLNVVDG